MGQSTFKSSQSSVLSGLLFACLLLLAPLVQAAAPVRTIEVKMGDYRFMPDLITVQAGNTVRLVFTNTDSITPHNFTLKAKSAGMNVDIDVSAGDTKSVELTPTTPGIYTFYCDKRFLFFESHRERGMEGKLVVRPAGLE